MKVVRQANQPNAWGVEIQVDLYGCNPDIIRDADLIREFVIQLCILIKMRRYGECQVVHFGDDPKVTGFSMAQLIETSLISAHFANNSNAVYLNVFSCKDFDPKIVEDFAVAYFKAEEVHSVVNYRK